MCSEHCETSKMDFFVKVVNGSKLSTISAETSS